MDLKDLKPISDTVDIHVKHPMTDEVLKNEDGSEMVITMYAPHSKEYKAYMHEQTNKRLKKMQGKKFEYPSAEEIEQQAIALLANITKDWKITFDKKEVKFTVDKANEIYTDLFWLRDQLEEGLDNSLDFTKV